MKLYRRLKVLLLVLCCSLIVGCATTEENQQALGASGGAVLGCLAGMLHSHNLKGCAVGAVAGAVVGFGAVTIVQYSTTQTRSASADRRAYGLTKPVTTTLVKVRKATANPSTVQLGQQAKLETEYSLQLPPGINEANVEESSVLKKDGEVVETFPPKSANHIAGGWTISRTVEVPSNFKPGTYVVETKVQTGTSYDVGQAVLVVKS